MVEHVLGKNEVVGSIPTRGSGVEGLDFYTSRVRLKDLTLCSSNSVGRISACQAECRRFESGLLLVSKENDVSHSEGPSIRR